MKNILRPRVNSLQIMNEVNVSGGSLTNKRFKGLLIVCWLLGWSYTLTLSTKTQLLFTNVYGDFKYKIHCRGHSSIHSVYKAG